MVELLPVMLWLDHAAGHPRNLCVSACLGLQQTYAELGIAANPRAVDVVVTNQVTDHRTYYGRQDPYWTGTTSHGHCILLLPGSGRFVDPTVEQFPELRRYQLGPICGRAVAVQGTAEQRAAFARGEFPECSAFGVRRGDLLLLYTVVDPNGAIVTQVPTIALEEAEHERSARNLASQTLALLAQPEVIGRARQAPHPRVRALLELLDGAHPDVIDGDWKFTLANDPGHRPLRLDELTARLTGPTETKTETKRWLDRMRIQRRRW